MAITVEQISKYGAIAALTAWVGVTNSRVSTLEGQLYKCMEGKQITNAEQTKTEIDKSLAILPKEIKVVTKKESHD